MSHGKFYSGDSPEHQPGQQDVDSNPPTGGDMLKSTYDVDNDGKVDAADTADTAGHATTADTATAVAGVSGAGTGHYYGTDVNGTEGVWPLPVKNLVFIEADTITGVDTAGNSKYYGTNGSGTPGFYDTVSALDDLTDVDLTTTPPSTGQALVYNGSEWVPDNPAAAPPAQLDGTELVEYFETTATAADENLNRADGGIQQYTMTANTTFTLDLTDGQSLTLHLNGGDTYTATWPTITWVGGAAPTLTAADVLEFWYFNATLFGAYVGDV